MKSTVNAVSIDYGDAKVSILYVTVDKMCASEIWHSHTYYEFHFATENPITYSFEDRAVTLRPGEMLIIPPGVKHKACGKNIFAIPLCLSNVKGEQRFYSVFHQGLDSNAFTPITFSANNLKCLTQGDFFRSVLGICKLKVVVTEFVYNLFYLLLKKENPHVFAAQKDALLLIDGLIYYPDITLEDLSKVNNYSKRHVSRLIKQHYGKTLSQIKKETAKYNNAKEEG